MSNSLNDFGTETQWEALIHKMAQLKADLTHLQREVTREDVPFEVQSSANFIASDYDNLIREIVEYEEGGEMPDECPVCGELVVEVEDLEPGESYDVDRMCVEEKTSGGPGHGILHWSKEVEA